MLILCPSCSTSYTLDAGSVGPAGRTVRCVRCRSTWFVNPPEPEDPVATFVEGVLAEAEAEAAPQAPEPQPEPALSTGVPVHPRDLDEQPGDLDVADDPVDEQIETTEPVQVVEAPPLMPDPDARLGRDEPHAEDIESFAGRRRRLIAKRQKARRSSRWTALVLVLFAFNVAVVGARQEVVRFVPQTASLFAAIGLPVNLRQLSFEDVRVSKEVENGVTVVAVDGKIVSKSARPVEVPRLRFAARNAQGREVYSWTVRPERSTLSAGESLSFSSFAKPPADAADVMVRFFTARDAAGGT